MAYVGRTAPLDKRRLRWLSFDEAIEALDLGKSRRVLRAADRLIAAATGQEPRRQGFRRAAAYLAEWLMLGALALLYVAPLPPLAAVLALPAGMLLSLAMRVLLRPLEGLVPAADDTMRVSGGDRLRLRVEGTGWITRTDYLGSPIRVAGGVAALLPGVPASGESWVALIALGCAAFLSWVLTRMHWAQSRTAWLRAPVLWLALFLAGHSIAAAGSALALAGHSLCPHCRRSPGGSSSGVAPASLRRSRAAACEASVPSARAA
jgi:hypothetical protein